MNFKSFINKHTIGFTIGSILLGLVACTPGKSGNNQFHSVNVGEFADKQAVSIKFKGTVTPNRFKSIVWGFTAHLENYNNAPFKYKAQSVHLPDGFHYTISRVGSVSPQYRVMVGPPDGTSNERVIVFSEKEDLDTKILQTYAKTLE